MPRIVYNRGMIEKSKQQYLLEIPGGAVELLALDDLDAASQAKAWLHTNRILAVGLKLFRYPLYWVERGGKAKVTGTTSLVEIPFYQLA